MARAQAAVRAGVRGGHGGSAVTAVVEADVIVVGGGATGCVLAARLSEDAARRVVLVEAGPDYGPYVGDPRDRIPASGTWPADLLDSTADAMRSHDWGYEGGPSASRARVIGGCSAHNGCVFLWGSRSDYAEWAAATGDPGWSLDGLRPHLERATRMMRAHPSQAGAIAPIGRAFAAAARELGMPELPDYNDPDATEGVGLLPLNTRGQVRWNAAFAYLDPARARRNLTILDQALVDVIEIEHGRAVGLRAIRAGQIVTVRAPRVVLCAGAYATPAILLRSGIGPADDLRELGIPVVHAAALVGAGLLDHPYVHVRYAAGPALVAADERHRARTTRAGYWQVKGRSSVCTPGTWDYTLPPWSGGMYDQQSGIAPNEVGINPIAMKTVSRGSIRLRSRRPDTTPRIDHGYYSDPDGHDLRVMMDAVASARRIGATRAWRRWSTGELAPGPAVGDGNDLARWIRERPTGTYHPSGTCRMGRDAADAVVNTQGQVFGLDGLVIADASIMPTIPAVNILASALAIAERIAADWRD